MSCATTLSELCAGAEGILLDADSQNSEGPLLRAMGLEPGQRVRIARQGEPCIVEVRGARIGLSSDLSRQVQVTPAT
ncbi:MAG: FeoA family protein [Planctomycetota bacterium]|nr:FeoA family protein [Planctomycetota bacterium]